MKFEDGMNINEVRDIFREDCQAQDSKFLEKEYKNFLSFLELDFYDWVKENLNQFRAKEAQR